MRYGVKSLYIIEHIPEFTSGQNANNFPTIQYSSSRLLIIASFVLQGERRSRIEHYNIRFTITNVQFSRNKLIRKYSRFCLLNMHVVLEHLSHSPVS